MTQQEHDHETRSATAESNQNHDGKPGLHWNPCTSTSGLNQIDKKGHILHNKRLTVSGALVKPSPNESAVCDDYFQARFEMMMATCRRKCMHLGCTVPADVGVVTALCEQCGVVSYYSTQVLIYFVFPHRRCSVIYPVPKVGMASRPFAAQRCLPHGHPSAGSLGPRTSRVRRIDKDHRDTSRMADEAWGKWLMHTSVPDAHAMMREKGVSPRSCCAIWLYFFILNRTKVLNPPKGLHFSSVGVAPNAGGRGEVSTPGINIRRLNRQPGFKYRSTRDIIVRGGSLCEARTKLSSKSNEVRD
ncbi:hypothetical protein DFH07DRAFT_776117 [Mycena maculata]|uniref:Uncharacterized protein n=1 Tax=Mycena maculata TaxID=230809 RepID=A0AAD7N5A3_9AGAR|nr:hypothetical protein DFH07DRAFT_776117 [Mycena maculata]